MPGITSSPPDLARRAALGDFSPEVLAWLGEGLRRHVIDGVSTDVGLRLDRASRLRARDEALRCAAAMLTLADDGPWNVALRLAQAVARYERKRGAPSTPLEAALAAAFATGARVPATARQLYEICR